MSFAWMLVLLCTLFLAIWTALTFTNQLCTGPVGFGLCYKSAKDPACPVCPPSPQPAVQPGPVAVTTTSTYEPEPYTMG